MYLIVWHFSYELFWTKVHSAFHARIDNWWYHSLGKQSLLEFNQLLVRDGFLWHCSQYRLPFGSLGWLLISWSGGSSSCIRRWPFDYLDSFLASGDGDSSWCLTTTAYGIIILISFTKSRLATLNIICICNLGSFLLDHINMARFLLSRCRSRNYLFTFGCCSCSGRASNSASDWGLLCRLWWWDNWLLLLRWFVFWQNLLLLAWLVLVLMICDVLLLQLLWQLGG